MRRTTVLLASLFVGALCTTAFGQIAGTDHDFYDGGSGWSDQICKPCHVPHHAYPDDTATVKMVLWNHQETDVNFAMYTTLAGNVGNVNGPSKLCLSCHDGVTAVDNYGGVTDGTRFITGHANIGEGDVDGNGDLSNDHPIGVEYPPTDAGDNALADYNDPPLGLVKLVNNRVECASCHDPHGTGNDHFLREPIAGSAICLKCHDK